MSTRVQASVAAVIIGLVAVTGVARGEDPWIVAVAPDNSFNVLFAKEGKAVLSAQMIGWGPNWAWAEPPASREESVNGRLAIRAPMTISGETVQVACEARQSDPRTVTYKYTLTAEKDVPLTALVTAISVAPSLAGEIVLSKANAAQQTLSIPQPRTEVPDTATEMRFELTGVGSVVLTLDPPCRIHAETGATRVQLAHGVLRAGENRVTLTFRFPEAVSFIGSKEEQDQFTQVLAGPDWFVFRGSDDAGPSELGFEGWLEKPAGNHGGVRMKGSQFLFEDGTPVQFWGTNLSYRECSPQKHHAELTAARFAKWGVNSVRLHKPFGPGWEGIGDEQDGTKLTPQGLEQMDYFMARLKEHGIYYGLSHTFGYRIRPGNKDRYLAYDEIPDRIGRQHVWADQFCRRRAGLADRTGRPRTATQEPAHGTDVGGRPGPGVRRTAERGRHLLLHDRERAGEVSDLSEEPDAPVRRMAPGEVWNTGGAGQGLGRGPLEGRDPRRAKHRHPG